MVKYAHRKNDLVSPNNFQALEVDLRSNIFVASDQDTTYLDLILCHDCDDSNFVYFDDFLDNCKPETELAINIKSAGLAKVLSEKYKSKLDNLKSYVFFDMSIPDQIEFQKYFSHNIAVRYSEYENQHNTGKVDYIWFDYFDIEKFEAEFYWELQLAINTGAKVIVVSPELHQSIFKIDLTYIEMLGVYGVCTDNV